MSSNWIFRIVLYGEMCGDHTREGEEERRVYGGKVEEEEKEGGRTEKGNISGEGKKRSEIQD